MRKIATLLFLLTAFVAAQTKYFLPIPVEQSNGRPINNANVDLYTAGTTTKVYDLTYHDNSPGLYYNTSAFNEAVYDVYVNGSKVYERISLGGSVTTADASGIVSDSIAVFSKNFVNVIYKGADSTGASSSSQAFQDAFDTAKDSGYVGVVVPKGTYAVKNVRIHAGMILLIQDAVVEASGSSDEPSPISRRDTTKALFHFYGASNSDRAKGLTIIGGTLKCTKLEVIGSENIEDFADGTDVLNLWDAEQIEIRNVSFSLSTRSNIMARNVSNLKIENCTFEQSSGPALYLVGGKNIVMENDTLTTVQNAVKALPDTANKKVLQHFTFKNNHAKTFKHSLYLALPSNVLIENNLFEPVAVTNFDGDSTGAIRIATNINSGENPETPYEVRNVSIKENYFKDFSVEDVGALNTAVLLDETLTETIGENINIEDNDFENNGKPNISIQFDADIKDNDIISVASGSNVEIISANIDNGADLLKSTQISDNRIYGVSSGDDAIKVSGENYYRIGGNFIFRGDIYWNADGGYEGLIYNNSIQNGQIYLNGNFALVEGNIIETNIDHGIEFGSNGNVCSVIGNRISMASSFAGVLLPQGCSNNLVCSNHINGGPDVGIEIINSSNHEICHNTADNATYGIQASESGGGSADNITISFNFVDGSTGDIDISGAGTGNTDTLNVSIP